MATITHTTLPWLLVSPMPRKPCWGIARRRPRGNARKRRRRSLPLRLARNSGQVLSNDSSRSLSWDGLGLVIKFQLHSSVGNCETTSKRLGNLGCLPSGLLEYMCWWLRVVSGTDSFANIGTQTAKAQFSARETKCRIRFPGSKQTFEV